MIFPFEREWSKGKEKPVLFGCLHTGIRVSGSAVYTHSGTFVCQINVLQTLCGIQIWCIDTFFSELLKVLNCYVSFSFAVFPFFKHTYNTLSHANQQALGNINAKTVAAAR